MAVLALAVAAGCDSKKEAVMTSGIDLTNLDTTAVQGADFYQYACGGWMKKHPLTNEYSRFGSFDMLAENNREQLKGLIVEIAAGQNVQGTIGQKIGDIYNLAMDSVKLNADGVTPIQADLEKIASVKDKSEIVPLMAELAHSGVFLISVSMWVPISWTARAICFNCIKGVSVWVKKNIIWTMMM